MSTQLNTNIKIAAPASIDGRYLSLRLSGSGSPLPYSATTEVFSIIPSTERYQGLTVLIQTGATPIEYWFRDNVTTLIEKTANTVIPLGDFVTGATNLGYFTGTTGVQKLCITTLGTLPGFPNFDGNYCSLYNYYFLGSDGKTHIGAPNDGIPKRGYVKTSAIPAEIKSWLWSDSLSGWSLVDGNISLCVGCTPTVAVYYPPVYTQTAWVSGVSNGSKVIVNSVSGSLTTGNTLSIGGPVYACMDHNNIHLRTIYTCSPNTLSVCYNEAFVFLSGKTAIIDGANIGTGVPILKTPITGTTLEFRRLRGSGATTITQVGDSIVISSTSGTGTTSGGTGTITGATNGLYVSGAKLGLSGTLCQNTNINGVAAYDFNIFNIDDFQVSTAGSIGNQVIMGLSPTAGVYLEHCGTSVSLDSNRGLEYAADYSANFSNCSLITKQYAQTLIASGATYNLSSPAAISLGGISGGTVLTGKTAFELFEELLVPELFQTSVGTPSTSVGATFTGILEIGSSISQTITPTYTAGVISPLYCTTGGTTRGGAANNYSYSGPSVSTGFFGCTSCVINPYVVASGPQTWSVCTRYNQGATIRGSKGTLNPSVSPNPLLSGCTAAGSASITGILPWFWGTSASGTINASMITGGTCTLAVVGASTPITFNAVTQYLWFAAPTGTYTTKTKWWVCAANAGIIGGTGELWKQQGTVAVTCGSKWVGCSFDVYVTCGITTTAVGIPMCLYY